MSVAFLTTSFRPQLATYLRLAGRAFRCLARFTCAMAWILLLQGASALDVLGDPVVGSNDAVLVPPKEELVVTKGGDPNRVALLIGNSNYIDATNWEPLESPSLDVDAMAERLKRGNFRVFAYKDLKLSEMKKAIEDFQKEILEGGIAFVYYSGHGAQFEGMPLFVPTDLVMKDVTDLKYDTIGYDYICDKVKISKPRTSFFVFDFCRRNPFDDLAEQGGGAVNGGKRFGSITSLTSNQLIDAVHKYSPDISTTAFAVQSGASALDGGQPGVISYYTQALLKAIDDFGDKKDINTVLTLSRTSFGELFSKESDENDGLKPVILPNGVDTGDIRFFPNNVAPPENPMVQVAFDGLVGVKVTLGNMNQVVGEGTPAKFEAPAGALLEPRGERPGYEVANWKVEAQPGVKYDLSTIPWKPLSGELKIKVEGLDGVENVYVKDAGGQRHPATLRGDGAWYIESLETGDYDVMVVSGGATYADTTKLEFIARQALSEHIAALKGETGTLRISFTDEAADRAKITQFIFRPASGEPRVVPIAKLKNPMTLPVGEWKVEITYAADYQGETVYRASVFAEKESPLGIRPISKMEEQGTLKLALKNKGDAVNISTIKLESEGEGAPVTLEPGALGTPIKLAAGTWKLTLTPKGDFVTPEAMTVKVKAGEEPVEHTIPGLVKMGPSVGSLTVAIKEQAQRKFIVSIELIPSDGGESIDFPLEKLGKSIDVSPGEWTVKVTPDDRFQLQTEGPIVVKAGEAAEPVMIAELSNMKRNGTLQVKLAKDAAKSIKSIVLTDENGQSKSLEVKAGKVPWPVGKWDIAMVPQSGYKALEEKQSVTVTAGSELPLEIPALQKENGKVMKGEPGGDRETGYLRIALGSPSDAEAIEKIELIPEGGGDIKTLNPGEVAKPVKLANGKWLVRIIPVGDLKAPPVISVEVRPGDKVTECSLVAMTGPQPATIPDASAPEGEFAVLLVEGDGKNLAGYTVQISEDNGRTWQDKGLLDGDQRLTISGVPVGAKVQVRLAQSKSKRASDKALALEVARGQNPVKLKYARAIEAL